MRVELVGRPDLLEPAVSHHGEPVAERHRLDLIVGHVDRRRCRARAGGARSRCASGRAVWRRGSTAARPSGMPSGRARSRGPCDALALAAGEVGAACGRGAARGSSILAASLTFASISLARGPRPASGRSPCSRARSCADRARSSGRPSRCPDPSASRWLTTSFADLELALSDVLEPGDHSQRGGLAASPTGRPGP